MGIIIGMSNSGGGSSGGASLSTAKLMKTGQTTSYRTGDDGDLEAGRATDFLTLDSVNPFSNLFRFTDELGTQTFANDIVIDWSTYDGATVLGIHRTPQGTGIWSAAIDGALALTVGSFVSGWYLPNRREIDNLMDLENTGSKVMDYVPLNLGTTSLWSSSTYLASIGQKWYMVSSGSWNVVSEANTARNYICARQFTVTGTTLT